MPDKMRLMLTSFGLAPTGFPKLPQQFKQIPQRMPPASLRHTGDEIFDLPYHLLLLYDQLVIDADTFGALIEHRRPRAFQSIADTLTALNAEGFVELHQYRDTVEKHRSVITGMVESDLEVLNSWAPALEASMGIWGRFIERMGARLRAPDEFPVISKGFIYRSMTRALPPEGYKFQDADGDSGWFPAFETEGEAARNLDSARRTLASYLAYLNSNLLLAGAVNASIHDWEDFGPFYSRKFLGIESNGWIADERMAHRLASHSHALFDVAFPEFSIESPGQLIGILNDRRVHSLREMIRAAFDEGVEFDREFASSVYRSVIDAEQRMRRYGRIVGYASQPLSLLPLGGLVQLGIQEAATMAIESRLSQPHRWFYLLRDLAQS